MEKSWKASTGLSLTEISFALSICGSDKNTPYISQRAALHSNSIPITMSWILNDLYTFLDCVLCCVLFHILNPCWGVSYHHKGKRLIITPLSSSSNFYHKKRRHGTCEACVSQAYQLCQSCRAHRATSVLYDFSHLGWWLMCMHEAGGPGHIPSLLFMHEKGHSKGHTASTGTTPFSQLLFLA